MKHVLQKGDCRLVLDNHGAELQSLEIAGRQYLWQADPAWWPRHSPVLFPLVGRSRNDQVWVDGKPYPMPQHGFARDMEFRVASQTEHAISFRLYDSGETLNRFPFPFELQLTYTVLPRGVHVRYELFNPGNRPLPFALGAHPGFALPQSGFENLHLEFSETESFQRHLLQNGLFNSETEGLGDGTSLPLHSLLFDKDAIVLKGINSRKVTLSNSEDYLLEMQFGGFSDFGIWTKAGCDRFLCLEPWQGHADHTEGPEDLYQRKGIHLLEAGKTWEGFWRVTTKAALSSSYF